MTDTVSTKKFSKGSILYVLGIIIGLYVLYTCIVGIFAPVGYDKYAPEPLAADATEQQKAQVFATGVTFALDQELNSTFGWIVNDILLFPGFIDNKVNYQKGVIYATRPASDMIAKTIARVGQRDTIDQRLADATSRFFTYGDNVWGFLFIYDCEGKYKNGIKNWFDWANSVGTSGKNAGIYNVKSDDVYAVLKYCSNMTDYALGILNDDTVGHYKSDDNIYYAKGIAAVAGNVLRALTAADSSVATRGGQENLDEALKRFDYIAEFDPIYVFAGGNSVGDAMLPNHVAALARHLDIANNRLNDMLMSMEK